MLHGPFLVCGHRGVVGVVSRASACVAARCSDVGTKWFLLEDESKAEISTFWPVVGEVELVHVKSALTRNYVARAGEEPEE